jgi:hypothetical protein
MDIKGNIDTLFRYVAEFEGRSPQFQTEAFMQTYHGIRAVFKSLVQDRNQAVETDYIFLDHVQRTSPGTSPLRNITAQVLISFFEAEADPDNRSNQAWSYIRSLRPVRPDAIYIEQHLASDLTTPDALHGDLQLSMFLLEQMADYMNKYGRPLDPALTPEAFSALDDHLKLLMLCRRRLELGPALLSERSSLEFALERTGALRGLSESSGLYSACLTRWGYLQESTFWSRVLGVIRPMIAKTKGLFLSTRYTRLLFSERRPAVFLQVFIILVWIALAVLTPVLWRHQNDKHLEELDVRKARVQQGSAGMETR